MRKKMFFMVIALFATVTFALAQSVNLATYENRNEKLDEATPATIEPSLVSYTKNMVTKQVSGTTDVWDFGATQLDATIYTNNLTETVINSWYASNITVGSSGNVLPSFTAGVLSWVGGSNDRLRTTNTNLTRYDENFSGTDEYVGRLYVNSSAATSRYLSLTLNEDDEVTIVSKTDAGGILNFEYVADPASQTNQVDVGTDIMVNNFVAKKAGTYHIFDTKNKPSYYRVMRANANYVTITGKLDTTDGPGLPTNYAILYENEAGKVWESTATDTGYVITVPAGYTYSLSIANANSYVITNGSNLAVTEATTSYDITIQKVGFYTVSGSISGLGDAIQKLSLVYTPDPDAHKVYIPEPIVDKTASTYTVQLEPNCKYTISAKGINDFDFEQDTITIGKADSVFNIVFKAKPVYKVTINDTGLTAEQLAKLKLTFTNLNEEGYVYTFASTTNVELRDGTYSLSYTGIDEYPVELELTSNLTVNAAATTKDLNFHPVKVWSFDDKSIASGSTTYKGLILAGSVSSEVAKGHMTAKDGATIKIPVVAGDIVKVTYYYTADFNIEKVDSFNTESKSTTQFEYAEYAYTGTDAGFVTIYVGAGASTSYFPEIAIGGSADYEAVIYVGTDKTYKTINEALAAISNMKRNSEQRVTVKIDPGNYEEMLVVTLPNITLQNASENPGIGLLNKGVDIADNAVRITSYYGHGYNYYSMSTDQKWHADVLRVNKENGYLSYENKGAGTTNGSMWNATVVISANGFVADNIIFENSYNQYISKKESEDIIVLWESGNKGVRPTEVGNTSVQDKAFVERAAAIAITDNTDKVVLNRCRVIGRQDSFFGGKNTRVVAYKGDMMGSTDYIFGGMTAVFYKSNLVMNTSNASSDVSYLTAAQQTSGRGYLMYECNITSAKPGTETASTSLSKPGYFGRPWQATTSEVVFCNTNIEATDFIGRSGESFIEPIGWNSSLGGESALMYEYGTVEESGVDNTSSRAAWSTVLSAPTLTDGTEITTFNFTKGADDWDPIPALIEADPNPNDTTGIFTQNAAESAVQVYTYQNQVYFSNVTSKTQITVYNVNGSVFKTTETSNDFDFSLDKGFYIIRIMDNDGQKAIKVITH